jgi:hypothetical protein
LDARLAQLEADIHSELVFFGKRVSVVLPVTGVYTVDRSEKTASALVAVASKHRRTLELLEVATKIVPALDLAEFAMGLGIAVMMDTGKIQPGSFAASMTGIQEFWEMVYGTETPSTTTEQVMVSGLPPVDVPPRFREVKV